MKLGLAAPCPSRLAYSTYEPAATSSTSFAATPVDVTGLIIYFSIALLIMRGAIL
jgi:Mg/Co/Ni transporter MgtE